MNRRGFIVSGVLVVGAVALIGLAVGRAGTGGTGSIAAAVVRVTADLGGGSIGVGTGIAYAFTRAPLAMAALHRS